MTIDNTQLTLKDDTINTNTVKAIVLKQLLDDKHITQEVFDEYTITWNIVVTNKEWYRRWYKALVGATPGWMFQYVKFK